LAVKGRQRFSSGLYGTVFFVHSSRMTGAPKGISA
jgi:hypothetical protein